MLECPKCKGQAIYQVPAEFQYGLGAYKCCKCCHYFDHKPGGGPTAMVESSVDTGEDEQEQTPS